MTTAATASPASSVLVTAGGVGALFDSLYTRLKTAAGDVEAAVLVDFKSIVDGAKLTMEATLTAVAPTLDKDVDLLDTTVTTAADAFIIARAGPVVETAVAPEVKALVDSTAATVKAQIDAWAAKYSLAQAATSSEPGA